MANEYRRFWMDCAEEVEREWLLAEAFEAGAEGAEEREEGGQFRACIYAPFDRIDGLRAHLAEIAPTTTRIGESESPPEVDWSEAWKEGLGALEISPRLIVRPPFIDVELVPGQREIIIDPGQAFGTGGHASTLLCLEWLDALIGGERVGGSGVGGRGVGARGVGGEGLEGQGNPADGASRFDRVLDVGTGSGVLALAAVALGARRAVGFDLDPVATLAAQGAARSNGLADRVHFFTGPIEALGAVDGGAGAAGRSDDRRPYPLVLANLLKREMLPIATEIAGATAAEGLIVLAGLLEEDVAEVLERFGRESFVEVGRRTKEDGVGRWVGLVLGRR